MRILTLLLISSACFGQPLVEGVSGKVWNKKKEYTLTDGLTFKYIAGPNNDTARYFNPGADEYELVVTAKKKVVTPPTPTIIKIEAESATNMVGAAVAPGGGIVCCIQYGAKITYKEQDLNGKTKVKFRYARGNSGNGTLTMKIGNGASTTLTFPNTGNNVWTNFAEVEFNLPANSTGQIVLESRMQGACDLDWFEFK